MNAVVQSLTDNREYIYRTLLSAGSADPNRQWLAKILASWLTGDGVLPDYLGLGPRQFALLLKNLFAGIVIPVKALSGSELDDARMLEKEDLIKLLRDHRKDDSRETEWLIGLIVSACLGNDHLWQDLGLWNRRELSALLNHNFPTLAARNTKDMKWKKFLYKQLCEAEGLYLCRAPSCEVCADYNHCFGPEE